MSINDKTVEGTINSINGNIETVGDDSTVSNSYKTNQEILKERRNAVNE